MEVSWLAQAETDVPAALDWLTPREFERLDRMRFVKRRNDYLLGRWTAKRALATTLASGCESPPLHAIEIRNAGDGAPEAFVSGKPAPLTLAMTDRAGWGVCAFAPEGARIGCDLELVEPRSDAFIADYLTAPEQRVVTEARTDDDRYLLANLMWCAKESALKILRTGLRRDTRSVEVTLVRETSRSGGWEPLQIRTEEGAVFVGWWHRFNAFLLTVAATRDIPPPRSLVEPSALHRAEPSHSWMSSFVVSGNAGRTTPPSEGFARTGRGPSDRSR